jgi:hypothetical protein
MADMCVYRIHPYTFALIYSSISLLALTENDVLNYNVVFLTLMQAQAVSMLYMQIVWYWAGKNEKKSHDAGGQHFWEFMYNTKEMSYALVLAMVVIAALSTLQTTAPLDYNSPDLSIRIAPLFFLSLSLFSTLVIQELMLDDNYGKDAEQPPSSGTRERLIWEATRITGGKLAVSLLLIAYGTLITFNLIGEYLRGLRAYADKLPERAWQYDVVNKYTIGTGFLPVPTTSL